MTDPRVRDPGQALQKTGGRAWAVVGIALVLVVAAFLVSQVSVVVIAAVLALFPAALLWPASSWLQRHRVPGGLAALLLILGVFGVVAVVGLLVAPRFSAQVPDLLDSLQEAVLDVQDLVAGLGLPVEIPPVDELGEQALDSFGGAGGALGQGFGAVMTGVHVVTGFLILLVTVFFVLKDGPAIWRGFADLVPARARADVDEVGAQAWWTLGSYFRGQLLVAAFDAVLIGIGLLVLQVPLALPLAVLVFFGGLFPIVGAFVTGLVAVLVALADSGPTTALLVLVLIVVVQQIESNLLEPIIMSTVIAVHPLAVLLAVAGGALAFGVLGAFLAVPVWAVGARVVDHLRGRRPPAGPSSEEAQSEQTDDEEKDRRGGHEPDDRDQDLEASAGGSSRSRVQGTRG